jgi:hypothetical protein
LHSEDRIRIMGKPDGAEPAPLDYIEITPTFQHVLTPAAAK